MKFLPTSVIKIQQQFIHRGGAAARLTSMLSKASAQKKGVRPSLPGAWRFDGSPTYTYAADRGDGGEGGEVAHGVVPLMARSSSVVCHGNWWVVYYVWAYRNPSCIGARPPRCEQPTVPG